MAFYYLLLGHLIGDFVLQTDRIAENKSRHWKWNLLHVLVVTLVTFVLAYPFGILLLVLVLLNGIIHFFMDYYKEQICKALHFSGLSGFLFDQLIHIMLLYLISRSAVYGNYPLIDFKSVCIFIALALATFFSAVFTQFILALLFPRADSRFFKDGEKLTGIIARIYSAFIIYLSFVQSPCYFMLLAATPAMFLLKFKFCWNKWMSPFHLVVKLLLDMTISTVCILPVILL